MAKMMARQHSFRFDCIAYPACTNCNDWYGPGMKVLGRRIQRRIEKRQWQKEVNDG